MGRVAGKPRPRGREASGGSDDVASGIECAERSTGRAAPFVGTLTPAGSATEAFTSHRAATFGGIACGSALGGALVQAAGSGGRSRLDARQRH